RSVVRSLRRTTAGTCTAYLVNNVLVRLRHSRNDYHSNAGATHSAWDLRHSLAYIDEVFTDYQRHVGRFSGRVAEIGPGDNCGVALRILDDGAGSVDLADRFYSERNPSQQEAIQRAI